MGLIKHTCKCCGIEYEDYFKDSKYCSKECYKNFRKENAKLKDSHVKHKKSNSSWQYEMDHKDDWRTVHEMGSL